MHVLIITPSFPPYDGSHTQRMIALANSLSTNNVKVSVLTTEIIKTAPGYNESSLNDINATIDVYRCKFGKIHRRIYTKHTEYTDAKYGGRTKKAKRILVKILEFAKNLFFIPDSLIDWKKSVLEYEKEHSLIQRIKPDFLISCSMPNTVHVISRILSKKYNVPMIMDYADPWVYIAYYNHSRIRFLFEKILEKKCIKQASMFSFSTKGAEELYIEKFKLDPQKCFTVVTGYDDCLEIGNGTSIINRKNDSITFTYGGALQPQIRFPEPFFKAFEKLNPADASVLIRTDNVSYIKSILSGSRDNIMIEEYIPFKDYYQEMLRYDVLLFWGNITVDQLPGKIFNYLPTKKLIFYIANNDDKYHDQAIPVLEQYGNYVYVKNDTESIYRTLVDVIEMIRGGNVIKNDISMDELKYFSTSEQFLTFKTKLEELQK